MGIASTIKRLPFLPTPIDQLTVAKRNFSNFLWKNKNIEEIFVIKF